MAVLLACPVPVPATKCGGDGDCPTTHRCQRALEICVPRAGGEATDAATNADARADAGQIEAGVDGGAGDAVGVDAGPLEAGGEGGAGDAATPDARADAAADASADAGATSVTALYRSVGPQNEASLIMGGRDQEIAVVGGQVVLGFALPGHVGIGDMLVYSSDDTPERDAIAMITGRVAENTISVRAPMGGPAQESTLATPDWEVYRAYTSLKDALHGQENPGIPAHLRDFDPWATTAPPSLVGLDRSMSFVCFADGVDDLAGTTVSGWVTDGAHWLRIFTPTAAAEVGTSQRHAGVWTSGAYTLTNGSTPHALEITTGFVYVEGLQIDAPSRGQTHAVLVHDLRESEQVQVSHCIVRGDGSAVTGDFEYSGVEHSSSAAGARLLVFNNLIYGFTGQAEFQYGLAAWDGSYLVATNNTVVGCATGMHCSGNSGILALNNLLADCGAAAVGIFELGTDHNATDSAELGYDVTAGGNTHDRVAQDFAFVDAQQGDFHLQRSDTGARDCGKDLSGLPYHDDIDGEARQLPWDIGADEVP